MSDCQPIRIPIPRLQLSSHQGDIEIKSECGPQVTVTEINVADSQNITDNNDSQVDECTPLKSIAVSTPPLHMDFAPVSVPHKQQITPSSTPFIKSQFDRELSWRFDYPQFYKLSNAYRRNPPVGTNYPPHILGDLRISDDPRLKYLETCYHKRTIYIRPRDSCTTKTPCLPPLRVHGDENCTSEPLDNSILAWARL